MADALQNVWFIDECFVSPSLDICSQLYMFIFMQIVSSTDFTVGESYFVTGGVYT